MRNPNRTKWARWASAALLILAPVATCGAEPEGPGTAKEQVHHEDPAGLEDAVLETVRGLLRDDAGAARAGMDRVSRLSRRLASEDGDRLGSDAVAYSQGMHAALDRARELAGRGDAENAFSQFVWVQRSCIACHRVTKDREAEAAGP